MIENASPVLPVSLIIVSDYLTEDGDAELRQALRAYGRDANGIPAEIVVMLPTGHASGIENDPLISHLGMSGNLRLVEIGLPAAKHEHVDIELESGLALRYTDPRRFGAMLWSLDPLNHELLLRLGPEPLTDLFDGERLFQLSRGRSMAVKPFIMDNAVVVGVGNIYATEALFAAGIDPRREAKGISRARYLKLAI